MPNHGSTVLSKEPSCASLANRLCASRRYSLTSGWRAVKLSVPSARAVSRRRLNSYTRARTAVALAALVGIATFAIGGYIVGLKSPGRTILEPGISAAIAVVIGLLLSGALTLGNVLAGGLVPFLAGLLGGWLGERRQVAGTAAGRLG